MNYEIELIQDEKAVVGEGPVWDPRTQKFYWTDIRTGRLFEYVPATGEHRKIHDGVFVGGLAVNKQGGLTLGTWEGVMLWRSDSDWVLAPPRRQVPVQRRDRPDQTAVSTPAACSTARTTECLYRFFPNGEIEEIETGLTISNGMGFSPDLKTFYHTDCGPRTIYKYDYDPTTHTFQQEHVRAIGDRHGRSRRHDGRRRRQRVGRCLGQRLRYQVRSGRQRTGTHQLSCDPDIVRHVRRTRH